MKKKIIFAVATGFLAVAIAFNINVTQSKSAGDVSLKNITVMAQASGESGTGYLCKYIPALGYCAIAWDKYSYCPQYECD